MRQKSVLKLCCIFKQGLISYDDISSVVKPTMRGKLQLNSNDVAIKKIFDTFLASCVRTEYSEKISEDTASKHNILKELQAVIRSPCENDNGDAAASLSVEEDSVGGYDGDSDSLDDEDDAIEEGSCNKINQYL